MTWKRWKCSIFFPSFLFYFIYIAYLAICHVWFEAWGFEKGCDWVEHIIDICFRIKYMTRYFNSMGQLKLSTAMFMYNMYIFTLFSDWVLWKYNTYHKHLGVGLHLSGKITAALTTVINVILNDSMAVDTREVFDSYGNLVMSWFAIADLWPCVAASIPEKCSCCNCYCTWARNPFFTPGVVT